MADDDDNERAKTEVMTDLKKHLPIEMNINDLYGLSQSATNLSMRGEGDTVFGHDHRNKVSAYEDVN